MVGASGNSTEVSSSQPLTLGPGHAPEDDSIADIGGCLCVEASPTLRLGTSAPSEPKHLPQLPTDHA